jgi:hypothetical protein
MPQERYLDERDYEAEHMDYHAVVESEDDEEEADDPEND